MKVLKEAKIIAETIEEIDEERWPLSVVHMNTHP